MALLVKNLKKAPTCLLYRQGKELSCFHLCCKYEYFWKIPSKSNFCDKKCENSVSGQTVPNPIERHRMAMFGRKRRLSPMDRISNMIETTTSQADQKDLTEIANSTGEDQCKNLGDNNFTSNDGKSFSREDGQRHQSERFTEQISVLIDKEFVFVVMENVKAHVSLKEMFLLEAGKTFQCKHGKLHHTDIIGHLAGKVFVTDKDTPVLVRRPSLEEYVIHMKRKATISYPKDCSAILMMVDVSPGDTILEAGTGSGAMTLFLSRAVGTEGTIHTCEDNSSHLAIAKRNIEQWKTSYNISHQKHPWPENICFHAGPVQSFSSGKDSLYDGAVIDLEEPHLVLSTLAGKLKYGKAAVIYVSNLSQIVEIAEMIRIKQIPLLMENVIDVTHKLWLVHPARRYQGTAPLDRLKVLRGPNISLEEVDSEKRSSTGMDKYSEAFVIDHVPKYITRPQHKQPSFSAFLIKLRKLLSTSMNHVI